MYLQFSPRSPSLSTCSVPILQLSSRLAFLGNAPSITCFPKSLKHFMVVNLHQYIKIFLLLSAYLPQYTGVWSSDFIGAQSFYFLLYLFFNNSSKMNYQLLIKPNLNQLKLLQSILSDFEDTFSTFRYFSS